PASSVPTLGAKVPSELALRDWIQANGGSILPCLSIVEDAPCGCRGVISTEPLPLELLESTPLIVVPERLYMSSDAARALLSGLSAKRFALSLFERELPSPTQLALLLAAERGKGDGSFWAPYIRSLPHDVPCAWALGQRELDAALAALGPAAVEDVWVAAVEAARVGVRRKAEAAVQRYGRHLGVEVEDVVWAMGQVLSRSFGRDPHIGLAPYIDLLNHRAGSPLPGGFLDEQDGLPYAFVQSSHFGETRELAAGDEVYISYGCSGDPLATFLNLGFVPPEMLAARQAAEEPERR
ncbi:hypothetical protein TSOC_001791, partial [Tetrabaena socialis]